VNPISLFEKEVDIWRISPEEQEGVWSVFAEIFAAKRLEEAKALLEWSTRHPERAILQHALQRVLKQAGLELKITQSGADLARG